MMALTPELDTLYRFAEDIQSAVLEDRFDDLVGILESKELRAGIMNSADFELLALRSLTALAWRKPGAAADLLDGMRVGLRHDELERARRECERVLAIADSWGILADVYPPPASLMRFLQLRPVVDGADAEELGAALRDDIQADPKAHVAFVQAILAHDRKLAVFFSGLGDSILFVAHEIYSAESLDPEQRKALDDALEAIEREVPRSVATPAIRGGLGVAGALSLAGIASLGFLALIGIVGTGLGVQARRERSQYQDVARLHLARAAGAFGIGRASMVSWMQSRSRSFKHAAKFAIPADSDDVLLILPGIGRAVRMQGQE